MADRAPGGGAAVDPRRRRAHDDDAAARRAARGLGLARRPQAWRATSRVSLASANSGCGLAARGVGEAQRRRPRSRRGSAGCCRRPDAAPGRARGQRLEVALDVARVDELRARDVDERAVVARRAPVVGDAQVQPRAGDRARALRRRTGRPARCRTPATASAARGQRRRAPRASRRHRDAAAPRVAGARSARRVAGSRSTACTPPKNRLRSRKATSSSAGRRAARRAPTPGLGVDEPVLEVHARREHGVRAPQPVVDDADDDLQDGRADAVRARAAEHELDLAAGVDDGGRGHHRRHPPARRVAEEAERVEVLLAHDVVHVDPGAGHDRRPAPSPFVHVTLHARPSPSMTEMWVVEPSRAARKRSAKPGSAQPGDELRRCAGPARPP